MPSTTQTVSFQGDQRRLRGYLARPEVEDGLLPGIVIIHEAFGLNDNIRDTARRFAEAGYVALAVDLFSGRNRALCMARFMRGMLLHSLDHGALRDLRVALDGLAKQPYVDEERLGAIGFCLGGGLAIAWACTDDRLGAIAPFYGMNPRPLEAVSRSCPVVGSYPEKDFTARSGRKLEAELGRHDVPHDIKIYPGTSHSFFNDQGRVHGPAASEDSWRRTLEFFGEHLGNGGQKN